ncbi:hypothetical protein [Ciceribacter lividus]|uniref:hypothetical protein n=1 Tax=Ciceribacter lividus TaxID=1197950 RepID=UPI0011C06E95|nr:hypothetical protein [Ciceribacter lividus]
MVKASTSGSEIPHPTLLTNHADNAAGQRRLRIENGKASGLHDHRADGVLGLEAEERRPGHHAERADRTRPFARLLRCDPRSMLAR